MPFSMRQTGSDGSTMNPSDKPQAWVVELVDTSDLKQSASAPEILENLNDSNIPAADILRKRSKTWRSKKPVSYFALHARVRVARGRPAKCEQCGTETAKAYDWANLTGNYADINDYKRLCRSCHVRMDGTIKNIRRMKGLLRG